MTPEEIAWVAGIIEGEGYIRHVGGAYRVVVSMTDEDVVRRLHETTGVGNLHGPYQPKGNRKQVWRWLLCKKSDTAALLTAIRPWLGVRRGQEADALLAQAGRALRPGLGVSLEKDGRWRAYGKTVFIDDAYRQPYLGIFNNREEAMKIRSHWDALYGGEHSITKDQLIEFRERSTT